MYLRLLSIKIPFIEKTQIDMKCESPLIIIEARRSVNRCFMPSAGEAKAAAQAILSRILQCLRVKAPVTQRPPHRYTT
jgi:hypothetical protein